MADLSARIDQFRKMTEADPENELGHFSLGNALLESGDAAGAVVSFRRVLELKPQISKVYQLLGKAQLKLGQKDEAIDTLKRGATIAHERGDMIVKRDLLAQLGEFGIDMPELHVQREVQVGEGQVLCKRCGQVGGRLPRPPFKNAFGQEIQANTCANCWREAIAMGTKVINELRLPMSDPQASKVWDQHIREFLNLDVNAAQ
jgi:Fe-S cluster biosynthesis and repair protein YggX/predicted TPR repeat methyltransferase